MQCLVLLGALLIWASATQPAADMRQYGFAALAATENHFKLDGGLYADNIQLPQMTPSGPAAIWPAGIQLSALNAAAALDPEYIPRAKAYADALLAYRSERNGMPAYQCIPRPKPSDHYFDDNEWLVLDFLETYDLTHDKTYLDRAAEVFRYVASGESKELGGGIWWRPAHDSKNTCSNAPAICGALRLYQYTHEPELLATAKRLYKWTNSHLQDADGLYWDTLYPNGSIQKMKWSYNTALMIRANCLLDQVTHERAYLDEAERVAHAAEKHWFGGKDGAVTDDAAFAHLLLESLLYLSDIDHDAHHVAIVQRALEALHKNSRESGDFYPKHWDAQSPKDTRIHLLNQASAARAFLVAARVRRRRLIRALRRPCRGQEDPQGAGQVFAKRNVPFCRWPVSNTAQCLKVERQLHPPPADQDRTSPHCMADPQQVRDIRKPVRHIRDDHLSAGQPSDGIRQR